MAQMCMPGPNCYGKRLQTIAKVFSFSLLSSAEIKVNVTVKQMKVCNMHKDNTMQTQA